MSAAARWTTLDLAAVACALASAYSVVAHDSVFAVGWGCLALVALMGERKR